MTVSALVRASTFLALNTISFAAVLMPLPLHMSTGSGGLAIDPSFRIAITGRTEEARVHAAALRLISRLASDTGISLHPTIEPDPSKATLVVDWSEAGLPVQALGEDESYQLRVEPGQARLHAQTPLGVLRGLETFRQLVETGGKGFIAPSVTIDDKPRFAWRGLSIDCSRHFMPISVLERNIDGMAAMKLNVFHWHLSDDQGFRAESRRFPKLTGMGSDGLFYTQDQIRSIIAYARERGIRVVPEFDMPGHSSSWLVGYPELASAPGPFQIGRTWIGYEALIDPTRESTYEFIDSLIGEMVTLFPDQYFHAGGDEVNDKEWKTNPKIQEFMAQNGRKDTAALHAYFNRRVQKIVSKYGKRMMGWDEILQPDLPRDIVIESWRGQKSLAEAARMGFQGILSKGYYLDLNYPASAHYLTDPLEKETAGLTEEEKTRILGGEAAIWCEYISPETIDSRLWPRLVAIAERFWSAQDVKDVDSMYQRLAIVSERLENLGLQHRSNYSRMLRRLAGNSDVEPLRVLADVVQPTQGYSRNANNYRQQTPLNRLVDAARPESDRARGFQTTVRRLIQSRDPKDVAEVRQWLQRWKSNDAELQPLLSSSFLLAENSGISKDLAAVAAIGLEALQSLQSHRPRGAAWTKTQTELLEKLAKAREMHVSIIPGVQDLIAAAQTPK